MALVLLERFVEHFTPPCFLAFEFLNCGANVLNSRRLLVFGIADDGLEIGVDLKRCFAARAAHFQQVAFSLGHIANLSRFRVEGRLWVAPVVPLGLLGLHPDFTWAIVQTFYADYFRNRFGRHEDCFGNRPAIGCRNQGLLPGCRENPRVLL